jgi:hypothetical protein
VIHPNDSKCAIPALNLEKLKPQKMLDLQTKSSHFIPKQADEFVVSPSLKPAFLMYLMFQN